jgi:plasmid stabilization system protein ParE
VRRVVWSRHAHSDFLGIIGYIAEENPAAARNLATHIDRTIQTLAEMPTGRQGRVSGTYEKIVRGLPYIVAYALGDEPKGHETLTILRIIHGARDWREESWPE